MDIERPHRTTSTPTTTSELFICFTSRLSKSSSMRLSSKSIHSPGRTTVDKSQPLSLSSSLSRRLRHNGSLRGAQSPAMFPSKKTKGTSGFADNPEPSSPKVTCIGQVRVKTKKQGKKMKMRACRSSKRLSGGSGGEASFRRIELTQQQQQQQQHSSQDRNNNSNNQRWVHLPLTICEALRAFGSEFSCLFPCKSSCFSSGFCGGEKGGKMEERENGGSSSSSSCAVFRWLVSLQEGEGEGKRRDIELVVGGEEDEGKVRGERMMMERECSRRRSIFDDMEFDDLFGNNNLKNESEMMNNNNDENEDDDNEESGGRVSIVVPPKNALLLMRCRSDPMKMASLSRKLWDPVLPQDDDEEVEVEEEREKDVKVEEEEIKLEEKTQEVTEEEEITEEREKLDDLVVVESHFEDLPDFSGEEEEIQVEEEQKMEEEDEKLEEEEEQTEEKQSIENRGNPEEQQCDITEEDTQLIEEEIQRDGCLIETITAEENVEFSENEQDSEQNEEELKEEEREMLEFNSILQEEEERENVGQESSDISTSSASSSLNSSEESTAESKPEEKNPVEVEQEQQQEEEARKSMEEEKEERENKKPSLPDCLLLMMCEPKVSMEVSKETWVCSTDFIRWLPERHHNKRVNKTDGPDDSTTKKKPAPVVPPQPVKQRFEPAPVQPGRSSISFPAGGGSVANLIEQKLVKGGGYEPFCLTRCKSAPLRSSAKVAAPEMACSLWGRENGRKLEPHRPATFGVGAAGVGF